MRYTASETNTCFEVSYYSLSYVHSKFSHWYPSFLGIKLTFFLKSPYEKAPYGIHNFDWFSVLFWRPLGCKQNLLQTFHGENGLDNTSSTYCLELLNSDILLYKFITNCQTGYRIGHPKSFCEMGLVDKANICLLFIAGGTSFYN